jgi:hypothetical protein
VQATRRGFLSMLGMAGAAALVPLPQFITYDPALLKVAPGAAQMVDLAAITKSVLDNFMRQYRHPMIGVQQFLMLGEDGMEHALGVDAILLEGDNATRNIIEPAAAALADSARRRGMTRFCLPPVVDVEGIVCSHAIDRETAVSVRGVMFKHDRLDRMVTRFDIVGG